MDFGETLLAAQKNQQQKTSDNVYYRAKFEPPKKEQKPATKLSANIQKFLAKKEAEERRKQEEAKRKRDELLAMRDPKATRKIQKMLKVIKSANKSVLEEATDHEHTAVTRDGADQPDQDDYGYESLENAAFFSKMMEKYSKMPEEEKFPAAKGKAVKSDLEGTRERMRAALQRGEEPQPRQRKSRTHQAPEKEESPPPPPVPEKKAEKPKIRRAAPPPIDFNQLLKLAEQKKYEPVAVAAPVKQQAEVEPERPMTKRQRMEFEQEQARREAKRRRMMETDGKSSTGLKTQQQRIETENKSERSFTRIPKLGDKNNSLNKSSSGHDMKPPIKDHPMKTGREKIGSSSINPDVPKFEQKKNIDMKSQNTYRIEKSFHDKRPEKYDRDEDRGKTHRESYSSRPSKPDDRGRSNREDDRVRNNRSEDQNRVNRLDERTQTNRLEDRNRQSLQGLKGQNNRLDDRNKFVREEERGRINKPEDRSRPQDLKGQTKRPIDHNTGNHIDERRNRPEDRRRINQEDGRMIDHRQVDQIRVNRENQKLSQSSRTGDQNRVNQGDNKGRITSRPDDKNRVNQRIDKGQNSREPSKIMTTDKVRLSGPEEKFKKENVNSNGHVTSYQNKFPQKSSSQPQFRKPELKEKLIAKERALFGSERSIAKPNTATRPDISKHPKSIEQRPREAPSKLLKPVTTDRRMVPNNNSSKPNQSVSKPATFDFDKHVNSIKKSAMEQGSGPSRKKVSGDQRNKNPPAKRRVVNSESEYDSELDDFIDDGDNEDDTDYSRHIQKIFGYDKSRYQDMDEDDAAMESSFSQQMREEYHSKKIGLMEDLEDMRQEALEKKKAKKKRRISDDD